MNTGILVCAVALFAFGALSASAAPASPLLDRGAEANLSCTSVVVSHRLSPGTKAYAQALRFHDTNLDVAPGLLAIRLPASKADIVVTVEEPVACDKASSKTEKWECETFGCTEEIIGTEHMAPGTKLSMETCGGGGKTTVTWTKNANGTWTVTRVQSEQVTSCGPGV